MTFPLRSEVACVARPPKFRAAAEYGPDPLGLSLIDGDLAALGVIAKLYHPSLSLPQIKFERIDGVILRSPKIDIRDRGSSNDRQRSIRAESQWNHVALIVFQLVVTLQHACFLIS